MLPSLLFVSAVALGGAPDFQLSQQQRVDFRVRADGIAGQTTPVQAEPEDKDPFRKLFRRNETKSVKPTVVPLDIAPGNEIWPQKSPSIECGLRVWRVDDKADPKIRVVSPKPDVDQKIAVRPPAPCTRNR